MGWGLGNMGWCVMVGFAVAAVGGGGLWGGGGGCRRWWDRVGFSACVLNRIGSGGWAVMRNNRRGWWTYSGFRWRRSAGGEVLTAVGGWWAGGCWTVVGSVGGPSSGVAREWREGVMARSYCASGGAWRGGGWSEERWAGRRGQARIVGGDRGGVGGGGFGWEGERS